MTNSDLPSKRTLRLIIIFSLIIGAGIPLSFIHGWVKVSVILSIIFTVFNMYCGFKGVESNHPAWFNRFLWAFFSVCLLIASYAKLFEKHGLVQGEKVIHDFVASVYFSVVTFTTLGYGDLQPTKDVRLWAASEALLGYTIMALIIALLIKYLSRL